MSWSGTIIVVFMMTFVGLMAFIRLAPSDPAVWHVDPTDAALTVGEGRALLRDDGDIQSPVFDKPPKALLAEFDVIADATPRTRVLAGSVEEGQITYITRSMIWGFPDYTSVRAIPVEGGSKLVAFGRLRFGGSDMGVNAARLESWLAALASAS